MSKPKVSVLVPIYNTEKYLNDCLDSVIRQTFKDIEVICVDDASTDRSSEILNEYANKDARIRVIKKNSNQGLLLARKTGIAEAVGEYICFLDSDDSLSRAESLQIMVDLIEKENTDILQFSVEIFGDVPEAVKSEKYNWLKVCQEKLEGSFNIVAACIENRYSWNLWNKIYRSEICKEAYSHVSDIYLVTAEDAYGYFLIAYHAKIFKGITTEPLYKYRLGHGSTTTVGTTLPAFKNYAREVAIISYIKLFLEEKDQCLEYQQILEKMWSRFLEHTLNRFDEL